MFDLDHTLVFTDALQTHRDDPQCDYNGPAFREALQFAHCDYQLRLFLEALSALPAEHRPRLAIVTRAKHAYAQAVLQQFLPKVTFDALRCFEDARDGGGVYKPHPRLVLELMATFDVAAHETVVVGDDLGDVEMAYRAGVTSILANFYWQRRDTQSPKKNEFFYALDAVPDAVVDTAKELRDALCRPAERLPFVEAFEQGVSPRVALRKPTHVKLTVFGLVHAPGLVVHVLGRYFAGPRHEHDATVTPRRATHGTTRNILAKEHGDDRVPDTWVDACSLLLPRVLSLRTPTVITIIPSKRGRARRMECLLVRLSERFPASSWVFDAQVFEFMEGAASQKHLPHAPERHENIEQHLKLHETHVVQPRYRYIVLDDVLTTGATLLGARHVLVGAGVRASNVQGVVIARNVRCREGRRP
ncbi:HAD hydrolase-like protein [Deinococcus yavapaiensis]|uniref:HAD superfamily hydrolase (TIGR01509 family) n=1 Tax=Deinococcus yavapaiensis KR-236 TaxID=694435 RepID=A0A318S260_9DEIO|nr:HAD hydrolase-like protein [Deinococcus yavapaiensis]PYE52006.1 HAD superfamily hydrolase (TIGR01509 family) [Deinococcus yavapaiensis KR-236]